MAGTLVAPAAYLWVCPRCGSHACFVLPGGRRTQQFISRTTGRAIIDILLERRDVDGPEARFLKEELESSSLVEAICLESETITVDQIFGTLSDEGCFDAPAQRRPTEWKM